MTDEVYIQTAKAAKSHIGQTLYWDDIDRSGRGYVFLRSGELEDVYRSSLLFSGGDYLHIERFSDLRTFPKGGAYGRAIKEREEREAKQAATGPAEGIDSDRL
ncbi:hypothetical protein LZT27_14540 [Aeromonas veronii]|uniref:hypothetical protein n=1 Tax=Aeromonas veronii TaxID=654 RepID=UPI0023647D6E|nr:hypothetical protein [Aeromonas veronii]MDD1845808.1 hypothetical protein [Aeromonas veronii]